MIASRSDVNCSFLSSDDAALLQPLHNQQLPGKYLLQLDEVANISRHVVRIQAELDRLRSSPDKLLQALCQVSCDVVWQWTCSCPVLLFYPPPLSLFIQTQ